MKTYHQTQDKKGSVIVVTLLLTIVVAVGVASAVRLCLHELRLSQHSSAWAQALHTAEAGVEVAMYEFYRDLVSSDGWSSGWTNIAVNTYALADMSIPSSIYPTYTSYYSVTANTATLTITGVGRADVPRLQDTVARTVCVVLERPEKSPFEYGMLAKDKLRIVGTPFCDSYDSRNGAYGGANTSTNCDLGSLSTATNAISGGGSTVVKGDVNTAPGGGVDANPGPFWTGDKKNDLDISIPDVDPPFTNMTDPAITGGEVFSVSGTNNMGVPSIQPGGADKTVTIQGEGLLRIYSAGVVDFGTPTTLTLQPDVGKVLKVHVYCNDDVNILGTLNNLGNPADLKFYGTTNCTSVACQANNQKKLTVYTPQAAVALSGTSAIYGAIVGNTITCHGTYDFHYDEALADEDKSAPNEYSVASWVEL